MQSMLPTVPAIMPTSTIITMSGLTQRTRAIRIRDLGGIHVYGYDLRWAKHFKVLQDRLCLLIGLLTSYLAVTKAI